MRGKKDVGKKQLIVNNFEDKILPLMTLIERFRAD